MTTLPQFAPPPPGLIVDLVTPLQADGSLDREGLARLLHHVAGAADGLLAGSPGIGEGLDLPLAVRRELVAAVLESAPGQVPLFLGITGDTTEATRDLALTVCVQFRATRRVGPVFLADLPLWHHSNRGLPQAYQYLLQDAPLPLVVLNLPGLISRRAPIFKRRNLRTHVFKKLAAQPGLVGLIYQGDLRRFLNYHHAAAGRPGFAFYEADEINFLNRPGAWGVVSAGAQLFPGSWQQVTRASLHPEEDAAYGASPYELWDRSRRLLELARLYAPAPAALLKEALAAQGVINAAHIAAGTQPAPEPLKATMLAAAAAVEA